MDVSDFRIKLGDVKVDSEELRDILRYVQHYHAILTRILEQLTPAEQELFRQGLRFTEFFQNKYIVLSELRQDQKLYYDILQKLKDEDYIKGHSEDEIEDLRREVWGMYIEAKTKREKLQKEIDQLKKTLTQEQNC